MKKKKKLTKEQKIEVLERVIELFEKEEAMFICITTSKVLYEITDDDYYFLVDSPLFVRRYMSKLMTAINRHGRELNRSYKQGCIWGFPGTYIESREHRIKWLNNYLKELKDGTTNL